MCYCKSLIADENEIVIEIFISRRIDPIQYVTTDLFSCRMLCNNISIAIMSEYILFYWLTYHADGDQNRWNKDGNIDDQEAIHLKYI